MSTFDEKLEKAIARFKRECAKFRPGQSPLGFIQAKLEVADVMLREIGIPIFPGATPAEETPKPKKEKPAPLTDEQWIASLKTSKAYEGIDIDREHAKMLHWCEQKNKKPSRARFVNWLNKIEAPLTAAPALPPGIVRGQKPPPASPAGGWNKGRFRERAKIQGEE